ncbi:hypothetical protein LCER1_G000446 [Lachnellula cervina]|uniref:Uncharacterized protein n=1 Tax=Lachnellula cervina TaxID=1316786 RepID=A0A7D8UWZ6_9HELO|nr:hypothetical protein LCER1_G000446 [Lachnellula cervina]
MARSEAAKKASSKEANANFSVAPGRSDQAMSGDDYDDDDEEWYLSAL